MLAYTWKTKALASKRAKLRIYRCELISHIGSLYSNHNGRKYVQSYVASSGRARDWWYWRSILRIRKLLAVHRDEPKCTAVPPTKLIITVLVLRQRLAEELKPFIAAGLMTVEKTKSTQLANSLVIWKPLQTSEKHHFSMDPKELNAYIIRKHFLSLPGEKF